MGRGEGWGVAVIQGDSPFGLRWPFIKSHIPIHFPSNRYFRSPGEYFIFQSISPDVHLWAVMGQVG